MPVTQTHTPTSFTVWINDLPVVWCRRAESAALQAATYRALHGLASPALFVMPHA